MAGDHEFVGAEQKQRAGGPPPAGDTRRDRWLRPWASSLSTARASFGGAMGRGIDGRRLWASSSALGGAPSFGAAEDAPSPSSSCSRREMMEKGRKIRWSLTDRWDP